MTPERWRRVTDVVADALEQDTKQRAAYVAKTCGADDELRAEVESMLGQRGERIERVVDRLTEKRSDAPDATLGVRLGSYEILREIGRGGMGAVYLARRADEQFEKEVAVKVLKRGTDTDEVLRRFRAERQILAQLEHPNIARLLDAGTTEDGLPYFVMEYVPGERITDYCDTRASGVRARVELFLKVCGAVQFAHRNLIVHRDLKPGNILVTREGEPKLLDFGIAKLLAPDGEPGALTLTLPDQQRLTPYYASPEQVRGEAVTTLSDVYSLGALLFELLAGKPPHQFSTAQPSPTELLRIVAEREVPRASAVAQSRELQREVRGDLDNILLTALRKEPERRYSGVSAFTDDLRRFLEHRPVRARPATFGYRASRFIRRNKVGVAAAALVFIAVVAGASAYIVEARRTAYHAQREAAHFRDLRKLANLFIFKYHDGIAALPGSTELRKQLVNDALDYLNNLVGKGSDDPGLLREVATAYKRIADVQGGAITGAGGGTLTAANLGDSAGALENYRKALQIREQLAQLRPDDAETQAELAEWYASLGDTAITLGKPAEAADYFRRALAVLRKLVEHDPTDKKLRALLRTRYFALASPLAIQPSNLGDVNGALEALRSGVAIGESLVAEEPGNVEHRQSLATGYGDTGRLLFNDGNAAAAREYYAKALAIGERLVAENPTNPLYRRELAVQHRNVGSTLLATEDKRAALDHFQQAVGIFEQLAAQDPNDARTRRSSAYGYRDLAEALAANGDRAGAQANFSTALRIFEELAAKDPKNAVILVQKVITHRKMSRFFLDGGDLAAATTSGQRAVEIGESLVSAQPDDVATRKTVAESYLQLGMSHAKSAVQPDDGTATAHWQLAKEAYGKSLAIYEQLKADGKLGAADANKPDELAREIANCDAALAL